MDAQTMNRLVEQARHDPEFFHALVFDTKNVLSKLGHLDRQARAALASISPEEVVGHLIGGMKWCDVTCESSCGYTCGGNSCGYTTSLQGADRFANPARVQKRRERFG